MDKLAAKQESEIQVAIKQPKIRRISEEEITNFVYDLMVNTQFQAGQAGEPKFNALTAKTFAKELKNFFATLSLEEVKIAFYKGVRGVYGEYFGLNTVTFSKWVDKYMMSVERADSIKQLSISRKVEEKKELTQEQKDAAMRRGCIEAFEKFKKDGKYFDGGNAVWNYLDRNKVIPFTKERRKEILEQVRKESLSYYRARLKVVQSRIEKRDFESFIKSLETDDKYEQLINDSKRKALGIFFKELLETGTDLKDLI